MEPKTLDPNDPSRAIRLDDVRALAISGGGQAATFFRNDSNAMYFQTQLEHVIAKTYEHKLRELKMANGQILPIRSTVPRGAETWAYEMYEPVGFAKFFTTGSWRDLPRADVKGTKSTGNVHTFGAAYGYNVGELERSAFANKPLAQLKAQATKRACMQLLNDVGLNGRPELNLQGFLNHPNMTVIDAPAGVGTAVSWTTTGATAKTGLEVLADLNATIDTMLEVSSNQERPNMIGISQEYMRVLQTKRLGTSTDMVTRSVLQQFKEDNPEVELMVIYELSTASAAGGQAIIAWKQDPEALWLEEPVPFEQTGPQQEGMEFGVYCRQDTGGVICVYPLTLLRMDFSSP